MLNHHEDIEQPKCGRHGDEEIQRPPGSDREHGPADKIGQRPQNDLNTGNHADPATAARTLNKPDGAHRIIADHRQEKPSGQRDSISAASHWSSLP
jgi:hypothetical protein